MAIVRRHLIIEPRFQASFTFAFVRGMLIAVSLPALLTFFTAEILAKSTGLSAAQQLALSQGVRSLALLFILAAGVMGAVSAIVGVFVSHRYAGPLKRVESWAARHLLGEPVEDLVLRPGDELLNVAGALGRVMRREQKEKP